ncbi:Carbonic anhydrase 2 [Crateriforma conspicua]|uniref:carbonic anhydrase n=1 Tax=Crateriforma conspicua TaxID=2527996 RepID=A0A5C6FRU4_9PLAN|nr:carbonic anhydrase [Crateriforma conspicua]TWU65004.1 Carbonic anhydrase 2 [Crateriforma conspicua]
MKRSNPQTLLAITTTAAITALICLSLAPRSGRQAGAQSPPTESKSAETDSASDPKTESKTAVQPGPKADDVLKDLVEGNQRFVAGESRHPHESKNWRASLEASQSPKAVILGCADSRVPPEIILDQGLGDLFVVRVAGNVVDTDVTASIEYAVDHCGTNLVVVMGHTGCGAVTAAHQHLIRQVNETDEIETLLYRIEPALEKVDRSKALREQINEGVRHNVELSVRRLKEVPDLMKSLRHRDLMIVGAVYDLHSGKVEFLK